jgi:AAA+ ATPase superfamily predicted ATPase
MDDPYRFCGREKELQKGLHALRKNGSHILIYGPKGVGKTSLAFQFREIANDNKALLERYNFLHYWNNNSWKAFNYCCDTTTKDLNGLINDILNSIIINNNISLESILQPSMCKVNKGVNSPLKTGIVLTSEEHFTLSNNDLNYIDQFYSIINKIKNYYKVDRLLIVIDELNNIHNKKHLAHFIRKCPKCLTLVMVGVADNISELIDDHKSVERQLILGSIPLNTMNSREILDIIDQSEKKYAEHLTITPELKELVVNLSDGMPWFTFLLLELCLKSHYDDIKFDNLSLLGRFKTKSSLIELDTNHLLAAVRRIKNGTELDFWECVTKDITNKNNKIKQLLIILANTPNSIICLKDVKNELLKNNITQYTKYIKFLIDNNNSIIRVGHGKYRFHNQLLRTYLRIKYCDNLLGTYYNKPNVTNNYQAEQ